MKHIKVVWKDSGGHARKPFTYRKKRIYVYGDGWTMDNDDNIYRTAECAKNAVDKALGGVGAKGADKRRQSRGIRIIGKKTDSIQEAL